MVLVKASKRRTSVPRLRRRSEIRKSASAGRFNRRSKPPITERRHDVRFLSIYKAKETDAPPTPEHMATMGKLIDEMMKAGVLIGTEGCLPSAKGARVRIADGKFKVTDGPFTESKELVGGFALLEAKSKEEAIEVTKRFLDVVGEDECEIRQLFEAPAAAATGLP